MPTTDEAKPLQDKIARLTTAMTRLGRPVLKSDVSLIIARDRSIPVVRLAACRPTLDDVIGIATVR